MPPPADAKEHAGRKTHRWLIDVLALSDQIRGSRVLGDWFGSTVQSMGIKKERADLLAYLTEFMADAKSSGLVKRSIETFKIQGVQPAK